MSYVGRQSLGDTSWCSPAAPSGCTPVDGVCMPMDAATLSTFTGIQRSINALLAARSEPLIGVDGRIGPETLAALMTLSSDPGQITGCDVVAANADAMLAELQQEMATAGARLVPDPGTSSPPTTIVSGKVVNPPAAAIQAALPFNLTGFLTSPIGIATVVVGGLIVHRMMKQKRGRRS